MDKIIMSGSFNMDDPAVQLAELHRGGMDRGWMQKRAAVLTKEIAEVRPEPGKACLHIIAMGDSEKFGPNRNADGFSKQANQTRHHTFVTHGHVFKDHVNHDPKLASGRVKASAYNPDMARTELLIEVDEKKWAPELEKLASGGDISVSMACKIPYDVCAVCSNRAATRAAYCGCMKKYAGRLLDDGRLVYVDNPNPTFFDISGVRRPADRIAYHLQKVASVMEAVQTGAELAELYLPKSLGKSAGIQKRSSIRWDKQSMLRKLSEMEKEIEGLAPADGQLACAVSNPTKCSIPDADNLKGQKFEKVLGLLGNAQISLPVSDFLRLVTDDGEAPSVEAVKGKLPGIFSRLLEEDGGEEVCGDGEYDPDFSGLSLLPESIKNAISGMVPGFSLSEGPVTGRVQIAILRKNPKVVLKSASCLHSITVDKDDCNADLWAREYAKYKLAFLTKVAHCEGGSLALKLGILQHYV